MVRPLLLRVGAATVMCAPRIMFGERGGLPPRALVAAYSAATCAG
ncbi:hypothetical protein RGUI_2293 [Rhodovulum sp. P5]|nr:hypothetical protein RGUI_2293 [Rhodovulum sp. P5]